MQIFFNRVNLESRFQRDGRGMMSLSLYAQVPQKEAADANLSAVPVADLSALVASGAAEGGFTRHKSGG